MSYDYFLWRTDRVLSVEELETAVEAWPDVDALRTALSRLCPDLVWRPDGRVADDCSGVSPIKGARLPSTSRERDPLVVRTSHRADSERDLRRLGASLRCLVYDAQAGEIVYQPESGSADDST